jgi:hypothetical protein
MTLQILQKHFSQILSFKPSRIVQSNGSNDFIAFISKARQLHQSYTCSALPEEFITTEEIQVDGRYHGEGEVRGG